MTETEKALRDRIAHLSELLDQLDEDGQWIAELMREHYERLDNHLNQQHTELRS